MAAERAFHVGGRTTCREACAKHNTRQGWHVVCTQSQGVGARATGTLNFYETEELAAKAASLITTEGDGAEAAQAEYAEHARLHCQLKLNVTKS